MAECVGWLMSRLAAHRATVRVCVCAVRVSAGVKSMNRIVKKVPRHPDRSRKRQDAGEKDNKRQAQGNTGTGTETEERDRNNARVRHRKETQKEQTATKKDSKSESDAVVASRESQLREEKLTLNRKCSTEEANGENGASAKQTVDGEMR